MSLHVPSSTVEEAPPAVRVTNSRRWAVVGLLFTASLINYFDRATISFALPLISTELHLGPEAKGVLLSAFFWSYALLQVPAGWLVDRVGVKYPYAASFLFWSVVSACTGFARTVGQLFMIRLLLGSFSRPTSELARQMKQLPPRGSRVENIW